MRKWIIALAAMLVVPAVGAAVPIIAPPEPEQLVEGHTVFTVIEVNNANTTNEEAFHAAVAVLVREVIQVEEAFRFPGVLWFNDQYLVNPASEYDASVSYRYPCTGAVLAVEQGAADPTPSFGLVPPTYVKSYHVTDPNDNAWDVDVWEIDTGLATAHLVWTVAINNAGATYGVPDNGTSNCTPKTDDPCGGPTVLPLVNDEVTPPYHDAGAAEGRVMNLCAVPGASDPGANGFGYPCGLQGDANCPNVRYNALLYFDLADLALSGDTKDHSDGSADRAADVSGCHPTAGYSYGAYGNPEEWPCPADDDVREGNSHDYNPENPWPVQVSDGRDNHGGSADCDGDGIADGAGGYYYTGDYSCHAMANIDIYYGVAALPLLRVYEVFDNEGSTAPYHCHDSMAICNQNEVANAV